MSPVVIHFAVVFFLSCIAQEVLKVAPPVREAAPGIRS